MALGDSLNDDTILAERAKALVPLLDAEAEYADNEGKLSSAAVAALHRDGLLKLWVPEKLGGAELEYHVVMVVTDESGIIRIE